MTCVTPADLLKDLLDDIEAWAKGQKARTILAPDPQAALGALLEALTQGPSGFVVVVLWAGDEALGEDERVPLATNKIELTLGYNLGLTAPAANALYQSSPTRDSFLDVLNTLRKRVCSHAMPEESTSVFMRYKGCDGVSTPDGVPLSAYRLRFELDTANDTEAWRG